MAVGLDQLHLHHPPGPPIHVFVTDARTHFAHTLIPTLRAANCRVHALAPTAASRAHLRALGCHIVHPGVSSDPAALHLAISSCTHVIHCPAIPLTNHPNLTPSLAQYVDEARLLLSVCRRFPISSILLVSHVFVHLHGRPLRHLNDLTPVHGLPFCHAVRVLRALEHVLLRAPGLSVCAIRPALLWGGPNDPHVSSLVKLALRRRLRLVDRGRFRISTCHVRNAAHAALQALLLGRPGEAYFVTDGVPDTYASFVERVLEHTVSVSSSPSLPSAPVMKNIGSIGLDAMRWIAWMVERVGGFLGVDPGISEAGVCLVGMENTVVDERVRRELGFSNAISVQEGLQLLKAEISGCT